MPDKNTDVEARLRRLAQHLRLGWAKLYAVTDKEKEVVRQTVRRQWEKKHQIAQRIADSKETGEAKQQPPQSEKSQEVDQETSKPLPPEDQDIDHDHGH